MDRRSIARELGRKGGQVRAARLTAAQRSRIASLGAAARRHSLEAARRIADNFAYAAAVATLRGETSRVTRMKTFQVRCPAYTAAAADMPDAVDHLDEVGSLVDSLTGLGLEPVLVGGMAMVILGSRRVTRDFDFVISQPGERLQQLVEIFYDRGLELAARVNGAGDVTATIDNSRVAATRPGLDAPASAYFSIRRPGCGSICCSTSRCRPLNSPRVPMDESSLPRATRRFGRRPAAAQADRSGSAFRARRCGGCRVSRSAT